MTTPILNIAEALNGQIDQYLTYNEALRSLESSSNDIYVMDLSSGDLSITNESPTYIFSRYYVFRSSGNAVERTVTVPASKRAFTVFNDGTSPLVVKRGTAEFEVIAGSATLFITDGSLNGLIAIAGGGGSNQGDVVESVSISSGVLDLSEIEGDSVTVSLTEDVTSIVLPDGAAGFRRDLLIRFQQDLTAGWTVDLSSIVWDGDGMSPVIAADPGDVTYISATNLNNLGWEGFK